MRLLMPDPAMRPQGSFLLLTVRRRFAQLPARTCEVHSSATGLAGSIARLTGVRGWDQPCRPAFPESRSGFVEGNHASRNLQGRFARAADRRGRHPQSAFTYVGPTRSTCVSRPALEGDVAVGCHRAGSASERLIGRFSTAGPSGSISWQRRAFVAVVGGGSLARRVDGPPTNRPQVEMSRSRPQLGPLAQEPGFRVPYGPGGVADFDGSRNGAEAAPLRPEHSGLGTSHDFLCHSTHDFVLVGAVGRLVLSMLLPRWVFVATSGRRRRVYPRLTVAASTRQSFSWCLAGVSGGVSRLAVKRQREPPSETLCLASPAREIFVFWDTIITRFYNPRESVSVRVTLMTDLSPRLLATPGVAMALREGSTGGAFIEPYDLGQYGYQNSWFMILVMKMAIFTGLATPGVAIAQCSEWQN
ncbi:hypothetical protein CpipJ_CPIJ006795 [Culex quinquefasciatus]|uniref:Uncharacterized protein n=1 Tax=Culex quinquefasciatus TaxID=7176 RepID=B0WI81_CULQU|nr:hypothetical protein CpipJ_CPIJ006795 [Culex quinquefasciatus]|eukprot:XP_001848415.1 hypothetical protein CpipJ_CPIJ006795 [Culex quinquefasciatus]